MKALHTVTSQFCNPKTNILHFLKVSIERLEPWPANFKSLSSKKNAIKILKSHPLKLLQPNCKSHSHQVASPTATLLQANPMWSHRHLNESLRLPNESPCHPIASPTAPCGKSYSHLVTSLTATLLQVLQQPCCKSNSHPVASPTATLFIASTNTNPMQVQQTPHKKQNSHCDCDETTFFDDWFPAYRS